ncbi:MAG: translocation/assembly module TamB domain-containing protein [Bacteroidetes bacterium]|nr:translocation/assembly module TamB domain-containing protein [Bacteroidota bacterium]
MKIFKKIYKWSLIALALFAFLIIASIAILNLKSVQNFLIKKAAGYLSQELKTTVTIQSIDFKFLNTVVLNGLYIEDLKGDTLGYFGKLKTGFNYKLLFDKKLNLSRINRVSIENSIVKFISYPGQKGYNYQFIVDYFSPPSNTPSTGNAFKLFIKNIKLKNVQFVLLQAGKSKPGNRSFNENNIVLKNINGKVAAFKLIGDSIVADIKELSFIEKSGFAINKLSSKVNISSTLMEFDNLLLQTAKSSLGNYVKLSYNGWNSFSDFEENVKMKFHFDGTEIATSDIAFFSDYLKKYNFKTTLDGTVKGTLMSFNSEFLKVKIGELNSFEGRILLQNVSQTDKFYYNLNCSRLYINPSNVQQILNLKFPEELLRIGSVKYSGILNGTMQNINSTGLVETTIGNIRTDAGISFVSGKPAEYSGDIDFFSFNTGKLFNTSKIGSITMFSKIDGKGFTLDELNLKITSSIDNFEYNDYRYVNTTIDGVFEKKKFTGNFDLDDPNAKLNLDGNFDFNNDLPTGSFTAKSKFINLKKLGFGEINISKLQDVNIDFEGKDIDNITVHALLSEVELEKNNSLFSIGNIKLDAFGNYNNRSIQLSSNMGNISLVGKFKISEIDNINKIFIQKLFPEFYSNSTLKVEPVDLRFDIDISDSRFLSPLFFPDVKFTNFTATGVYNSENSNLDIVAMVDNISYKKYLFDEINLQSQKNPDKKLSLDASVGKILNKDSLLSKNLIVSAEIGINDIDFSLLLSDTTDNLSLNTEGKISLNDDTVGLNLKNSSIYIYNQQWKINDNNYFTIVKNTLEIDSFKLWNGSQFISAEGTAGIDKFSELNIKINNLNLVEINPILKKWDIKLQGIVNSNIDLNGSSSKPIIKTDLTIDNLIFNSDSVGNVVLYSRNQPGSYLMRISGMIKNGIINNLILLGSIDITPQNEKINLNFTLSKASLKPFETITKGLFSNVKGIIDTAVISLTGNFEKIETKGDIEVVDASMIMDYLGIPLNINKAKVKIDKDKINLGEFEVADKYGSKAKAGGVIFHKNFNNFKYAIFMKDLKNFNCMNLTEEQGDLFFGNAFVDGNMVLNGTIDNLYLNINARSRPKTVISLPLASTTETTGPDYIKIVDLRGYNYKPQRKSLTGITMDFNFNITNDAELRLIFDSKFDDVIKATGEGNIKMELNTYGDFYMYGSYIIDKGSYNFTALNNLVNKNLKVKNGGKIVWNGNPYEAIIDMVATTTVNVDPSVILPSATIKTENGNSNVGINCNITLKENLFHPQITLGIDVSDENSSTLFSNNDLVNVINMMKTDQEEVNKQFINLLVFNSFAPSSPGISTATSSNLYSSVQNSLGAFMTTQVNSWLRQIDPNWELGIDWKNSQNIETQKQIMVSLKRKLFNEKIEVAGVYGQAGNSSYDFNLSYKIKQDGRLRLRGFNRRANDPLSGSNTYINTSGVGLYYRKELDYLFPKMRKKIYEKKH